MHRWCRLENDRLRDVISVTIVPCNCVKPWDLFWLLGSFTPFKMCPMFSAVFGPGISQAPRRIMTAVVERSVTSRTSQDGSPYFCSWDKSDFFFSFSFLKCMIC